MRNEGALAANAFSWIVLALAANPTGAQTLVAKLTASDGDVGDNFGAGLALSGETVLVGSLYDDDLGDASGSAYIFARNQGGPDAWGQVTKLTADDGVAGDEFGFPVWIAGELAIVGARNDDDHGTSSGSAYIFARDSGGPDAWGQVAKLTASDGAAEDRFGRAVAIGPNLAVVGAPRDDDAGERSGSAYVFARNQDGPDAWGELAKLTAPDAEAGDGFGAAIAIDGDLVLVGAHRDDDGGTDSGAAYLFGRNEGGSDAWGLIAKLKADDASAGDDLGYSVSIAGEHALAGARRADGAAAGSGAVYVFARDEGGPGQWGQLAKLVALDGEADDVFSTNSVSRDIAIIGAVGDDDDGENSGSAYLFASNQGGPHSWGQVAKLTAVDGEAQDIFGFPVAIGDNLAAVGAYQDDDRGDQSGSVYVFDVNGPIGVAPTSSAGDPRDAVWLSRPAANPMRRVTEFAFGTPTPGDVRLTIHDLGGRLMRTVWVGPAAAGRHRVIWDGLDDASLPVGSGVFFVRLRAAGQGRSLKIVKVE